MSQSRHSKFHSRHGVTLIEMMVALAVIMAVVYALSGFFLARTRQDAQDQARREAEEHLDLLMESVQKEFANGGFEYDPPLVVPARFPWERKCRGAKMTQTTPDTTAMPRMVSYQTSCGDVGKLNYEWMKRFHEDLSGACRDYPRATITTIENMRMAQPAERKFPFGSFNKATVICFHPGELSDVVVEVATIYGAGTEEKFARRKFHLTTRRLPTNVQVYPR